MAAGIASKPRLAGCRALGRHGRFDLGRGWLAGAALALCLAGPSLTAAQEIETVDAAGVQALIAAARGGPVVVNFWATWCPPCLKEFPDIVKTYEQHRDQGLTVIAVSMNEEDEIADIEEFLASYAPPFPVYRAAAIDEAFYTGIVEPWYGELPITLIFDAAGERAQYHRRAVTYDELAAEVAALLPSGTAD